MLTPRTRLRLPQLHGATARAALVSLPERLRVISVLTAQPGGGLSALAAPAEQPTTGPVNPVTAAFDWVSRGRRTLDWLLVDSPTPGSGEVVEWAALRSRVPRGASRKGWLLAGGLTPDNVASALSAARPQGVDVASGVADAGGVRKDPARVTAFIAAVREWAANQAHAPAAR